MRTDGDVGLIPAEIPYERVRIQAIKRSPDRIVLARIIEIIIQPAQNFRGLVDQIDVGFGIEVAEDLVGVFEHVEVLDVGSKISKTNRFFDGFGCAKVTCTRTGRENQNTS